MNLDINYNELETYVQTYKGIDSSICMAIILEKWSNVNHEYNVTLKGYSLLDGLVYIPL